MEFYLKITHINDFLFCPISIYYHELYGNFSSELYHKEAQSAGKTAHEAIDEKHIQLTKIFCKALRSILANIEFVER